MKKFEIYPAIDLIGGEVVRLAQGDRKRKTVYSSDPVSAAREWLASGADWLHIVNLDGAFESIDSDNLSALRRITADLAGDAKIQFGGGIRNMASLAFAMDCGVTRVVIGTAAVENPDFLLEALREFGSDRIAVGLDAVRGEVKTHGWTMGTGQTVDALSDRLRSQGVRTLIYTDINRDGMGTGVDWAGAKTLANAGFNVIASGGAAGLGDVRVVRDEGLAGLIIGKALYDGRIDLSRAISLAGGKD